MQPSTPKPRHRTIARSALVGVVATLVDLIALYVLVELLGVDPAFANAPALTLGLVVQFVGNKYYAFEDRSQNLARQGGQFVAIETGAFLLNLSVFHVLAVWLGAPWVLARVVASGAVYLGFSYPLWTKVFRPA
jgi:putative flippase GtrA